MILAVTEQTVGRSVGTEMLIMLFLFLGMWFILIAPQRKKQKKHEAMVNALKPGDKILTTAGIFGEIKAIQADRFEIKVDGHTNTTIEIHRSFISTKL
ncbi:MAG: preprotein translocase subunit YajC [Puniceicoccales bacterium]|jgi:preprotein translocase subunit YajC|nr:preprotein translocase subunit YajC [Puniceicoccales bacterium]